MQTNLMREAEEFKDYLSKNRDKFCKDWLTVENKNLVEEQTQNHAEHVRLGHDKMSQLKTAIEQIRGQRKANKEALEEKMVKLEELKSKLNDLHQETDTQVNRQEKIEADLESTEKQIKQENEALQAQDKVKHEKLQYLEKAFGTFTDNMGFSFKKTSGGRLQMIFRNLDQKDHEKIFYFFIKLEGEDRKYTVSECEPEVTGLSELVEKLNQTNNLRSFVVAMRKKFKALT